MADKKVIGRPFQKGVSGNPFGRSKDTHTISQLAKAYTQEAIEKLAEIMRTGKTEQAQVRAAADSRGRYEGQKSMVPIWGTKFCVFTLRPALLCERAAW